MQRHNPEETGYSNQGALTMARKEKPKN